MLLLLMLLLQMLLLLLLLLLPRLDSFQQSWDYASRPIIDFGWKTFFPISAKILESKSFWIPITIKFARQIILEVKTRLFGLTLQFLIGKLYGKMKMRADVYFSPEMYVECWWNWHLFSISSIFYTRVRKSFFGSFFLVSNPKHSFVILAPKFRTKNARVKRWLKPFFNNVRAVQFQKITISHRATIFKFLLLNFKLF